MQNINPIGEDAFDFPMAYCWRAYYEETIYGRYLPPLYPKPLEEKKEEPLWTKGQRDMVEQLNRQVLFLQKKIYQHTDVSKKRKVEKFTIKE